MDVKPVFCEPRVAGEQFDQVVDKYYKSIESGSGGLLLGVCRGKVMTKIKGTRETTGTIF